MPQPEKRQPRATRSFAALRNTYLDTAGPEEDMPETPEENQADQREKQAEEETDAGESTSKKSRLSATAPPHTGVFAAADDGYSIFQAYARGPITCADGAQTAQNAYRKGVTASPHCGARAGVPRDVQSV